MTIDERELARLLEETAARSSPPRFTAEELTSHIRRRRALVVVTGVGVVMAVAALAVSLPGALSAPSQAPAAAPGPVQASYTVTVNGRTQHLPFGGSPPGYAITPGETLAITVDMTIPARTSVPVTALWLGITDGVLAPGPNGPAQLSPILSADTRASLGPGTHRFTLRWVAPVDLRPGTSRQLSAEEKWSDGETERMIAVFNLRR
jgi:hypothetical protein